jgi:hypothetical protein
MQKLRIRGVWLRTVIGSGCLVSTVGCGSLTNPGSKCGGAQTASAFATLPDTGIAAGTEVQVVLSQFDPFIIGELSDIAIQHLWPATRGPNPEADPRVRLVRDDGRVLLDTLSTRRLPNDGDPNRSTWIVVQRTRAAERRNAVFDAMQAETLWLELWRPNSATVGTRVRLHTTSASVSPIATCL